GSDLDIEVIVPDDMYAAKVAEAGGAGSSRRC
ncbi:MAG: hypothetical protein JWN15_256, partial [Firmicutes bacterium]|nr:hypothetical protein [Bacillota bacterium]